MVGFLSRFFVRRAEKESRAENHTPSQPQAAKNQASVARSEHPVVIRTRKQSGQANKGKARSGPAARHKKSITLVRPDSPPVSPPFDRERIKHEKNYQRRQIRQQLQELLDQGERCQEAYVLDFINRHAEQMDLLREMFAEFHMKQECYPLDLIWQHLAGESRERFQEQLTQRKLLSQLERQRDDVAARLPDPLQIQVPGSAQGPQFAAVTAQIVHQEIQTLLGTVPASFEVSGPFPCSRPGDYSLQLDFSHEIVQPLILRLEVRPDPLPLDCRQALGEEITPIVLDFSQDILTLLQQQLAEIPPTEEIVYYLQLSVTLVTAYHYGYGQHSWVHKQLKEWRSKRVDSSVITDFTTIKDALERLNRETRWRVPGELLYSEALPESLQSSVQHLLEQDPVLSRYTSHLQLEISPKEAPPIVVLHWNDIAVGNVQLYPQTGPGPERQDISCIHAEKAEPPSFEEALAHLLTTCFHSHPQTTGLDAQSLQKHIKRRILDAHLSCTLPSAPPTSPAALQTYLRSAPDLRRRADACLPLLCLYPSLGEDLLFRLTLAQYCLASAQVLYTQSRREARPYLHSFLLLTQQVPQDILNTLRSDLYRCAAFYVGTYNLPLDTRLSSGDTSERFSSGLRQILDATNRHSPEALGRCLLELTQVAPSLMLDQFNRWKTRQETRVLHHAATVLQAVFRLDPLTCLQVIARLDPSSLGQTLSRQSFATADERRRAVIALVRFAAAANAPTPTAILAGFAAHSTSDTRIVLAFSLLIEPFVLPTPSDEPELKAALIAEALGLPAGIAGTEYFLGKTHELATLFDRFLRSQSPTVKGNYAISILDMIRAMRRPQIDHLRSNLSERSVRDSLVDTFLQFLRRVEAYVTAEQAKLIHDTTLELVLLSDRTLHAPQHTRLAVEIRNVGEGIADHLRLEVLPVVGQYNVEDRYRVTTIDHLTDKTPIQVELFISPLVEAHTNLEITLHLRYDTLKKKDKQATLSPQNQTVWLYPESQFVRVRQPYNPGVPATTWFYGRKELLEVMADSLRSGQEHDTSMVVYGIKRAGKTSVVRRFVEHTLAERGLERTHIPIYADLLLRPGAIRTDRDLLWYLLELIHQHLTEARHLTLPFTPGSISSEFQKDHQQAFTIHLNEVMATLGEQRLLLVLDEFSTLNAGATISTGNEPSLSGYLFGFLSNIIQSHRQLTFIFTGTYMLLDLMRSHMYDLFKICKPFLISFLDDTSARLLITEPVRQQEQQPERGWLTYDPRVVDRMVTLTHCHPYLIQNMCGMLVDRMNGLKYHRVNLNDLEVITNEIVTNPVNDMILHNLWREFKAQENSVLSVIADLAGSHQDLVELGEIVACFHRLQRPLPAEQIAATCTSLKDAELLEKLSSPTDQSEAYRITIPLYQRWIKQNWPPHAVFGKHVLSSPG